MFSVFGIAIVFTVLAIVLAIFISRQPPPGKVSMIPPEDDFKKDAQVSRKVERADLYQLAEKLCRENELRIKEKIETSPQEAYWIAESTNAFFYGNYVLGFCESGPEKEFVTMTDILEFKDFIKSVSSTKGFYFTTGYFTSDVHQPLEGPKVALYNKLKVLEELDAPRPIKETHGAS